MYAEVMVHSSSEANNGHQAGFLDGHCEWITMDRVKPRSVQNGDPTNQTYGGLKNLDWTKDGFQGYDIY